MGSGHCTRSRDLFKCLSLPPCSELGDRVPPMREPAAAFGGPLPGRLDGE